MVSNYILHKTVSSQSFQTDKHFILSYNIDILKVNVFIKFIIVLNIFLNKSIWPIDGTLRGIAAPNQSGSGSNGKFLKWNFTTRFSFLSYPGTWYQMRQPYVLKKIFNSNA